MASTSNPAANKGKAPAWYGDDHHHHDRVKKMKMMREESVSMGISPGWRFRPTDKELIEFYLINRTLDNSRIISLPDIYQFTPMQLAEYFEIPEDPVMFFYTTRKRKHNNGKRPSRTANGGYWEATGGDIRIPVINGITGLKISLVFYLGQRKQGVKTNWIMHEYRVEKEEFEANVLCKVYKTSWGNKSTQNTRNEANTVSKDVGERGTNPSTTRSQAEEDLPLLPPPPNIYGGSSSSSNLAGQYDVHKIPQRTWYPAPMVHAQLGQEGYPFNDYPPTAPNDFAAQSPTMYGSQPDSSGYGMAPSDTTEGLYLLDEPLPDFGFPVDDNSEYVPYGMPVESAKPLNSASH